MNNHIAKTNKCAVVFGMQVTTVQLYPSWDTFEFDQGACNQESINDSACCVEWKFRSVTRFIVVSQFLLTYERSRIQCLLLFHNFYYLTKGAAYNISLCPSIPTNSLKSKSGKQHALFLLSVYMIPIIQGESYSQVALLIRRLPSNRPTAMLMIYKLLSCYPILTKMKSSSKNKMALVFFFPFSVLLFFFFAHQRHITVS